MQSNEDKQETDQRDANRWPCSHEKHDEQRRSGDWEERAGGTLYCPYCGIMIGKFRR